MINYLMVDTLPTPGVEAAGATREQEAMARQRGFRSYEEMLLWAKQRNQQSGGTVSGAGRMPQTWGQAQQQIQSAHPKSVFEYITRKLQEATQ